MLKNFGLPDKLANLIKKFNYNATCKIRFLGRGVKGFEVKSCLRQGNALYLILVNVALEKIVKDMHESRIIELYSRGLC